MAAEIPDGAVLVARAILNSSLWTMKPEDCKVAMTCIALANWKDRKWFDGEKEITIHRGQFVRSHEDFAKSCGLSLQKTRTSIKHLEKVGFLTRTSTTRYTVFTVPKYSHYQDITKYSDSVKQESNPVSNPPLTHGQPAPNPRLTHGQPAPNHKQEDYTGNDGKELQEGGISARLIHTLAALWNRGPGLHLNGDKAADHIQAAIHVGVTAQEIEQAFMDHEKIKGIKIWEVLDSLRKRKSNGSKTWDEILRDWAANPPPVKTKKEID